jgi:SAM-dependent methyltransferase
MLLVVIALLLLFCFSFVLLFGAPYLPTMKKQRQQALDLLDLKNNQLLIELGCGDGRLLRAAAKRGIRSIGYELNPILVAVAKVNNYKNRKLVIIKWANYWNANLPNCDGMYVFLLDRYMQKLDTKLKQAKLKKFKLVSYAFRVPNRKYTKKLGALYLYKY